MGSYMGMMGGGSVGDLGDCCSFVRFVRMIEEKGGMYVCGASYSLIWLLE